MKFSILLLFEILLMLSRFSYLMGNKVPVLLPSGDNETSTPPSDADYGLKPIPFSSLVDKDKDTSEFWRQTEILSLVMDYLERRDYTACSNEDQSNMLVRFPSRRTVRPICRGPYEPSIRRRSDSVPCFCRNYPPKLFKVKNRTFVHKHLCPCHTKPSVKVQTTRRPKNLRMVVESITEDNEFDDEHPYYQLCPQCPRFTNYSECELFRDSCKERKVLPTENQAYCDRKYGKWRTLFIPADYSQCRCCDECVRFRELDQSCLEDEYSFDSEEFLPVTSIDFRAGCNQYWGHPEQEIRALRCDKVLRRCVPVSVPPVPNETLHLRRNFRYEPPTAGSDCPINCRGYKCKEGQVNETSCRPGAFLPDKDSCNCCGKCSSYQQINEKCAEFKKTVHVNNGSSEIEVEEEFLEPGCDDGLVCRQGRCQDIHTVKATAGFRRKRDESDLDANEPCKKELKLFKKKFGPDGHLHYNAPQCTPLWLYAPVQCRRFVCYCSLEDGTFIQGIKVPRVEVSNMNCDCAREKCRTGSDVECDGYGNYKEAVFTLHADDWTHAIKNDVVRTTPVVNVT